MAFYLSTYMLWLGKRMYIEELQSYTYPQFSKKRIK